MQQLLADLANAERHLRHRAAHIPGLLAHADALTRLQALVSARPRVILVGESNVGKTSIANLLLGQAVLPDSVITNTRRPLVLHHSATVGVVGVGPQGRIDLLSGQAGIAEIGGVERLEVGLPSDRLLRFDLVDTPGVAAAEELDPLELRTSDLLLWCTIATQAWKASERGLWMSLPPRHRRHAILVVTHRDALQAQDVDKVAGRLAVETEGCFRATVFVGAAAHGDQAAETPDGSGLVELERRIDESLAAIDHRRRRAGYRIANHIVNDSMAALVGGRSASPLRVLAARLLGRRRPAWRSIMRLPPPRERRLRAPRGRALEFADAPARTRRAVTP
ncbi:MAG TPA: dynamin family protein [Xanthobacteraceae bacterium]|nr:dynamin family protein [Xanthobacteraceae bacterium]